MNKSNISKQLEKSRVLEIANEYKKKGYEVYIQPSKSQRPGFLENYQPDLIALSPLDKVVVEIKSKESLKQANILNNLAKIIETHKDWRLDFVMTNPKDQVDSQYTWTLLSVNEIKERLNNAIYVYQKLHQKEFGMLLLWVVIEATLQRVALSESIYFKKPLPKNIIKELYSYGIYNKQDYLILNKAAEFRNGIVHGYSSELPVDSIFKSSKNIVTKMLKVLSKNIKFGEPRFINK